MANWSNPQLTSKYTDFLTEVKARDVDIAVQFNGTTSTNIPNNAIKWDAGAGRWKKYNTSLATPAWEELTTTYKLKGLEVETTSELKGNVTVTTGNTLTVGGLITGTAVKVTGTVAPSNEGIYKSNTDQLGFATEGNLRAILNSSGLKLHTSGSADFKLDVHANTGNDVVACFRSTDESAWIELRDDHTSASHVMLGARDNDLKLRAGNSTKVTVKNTGKVGINKEDPDTHLHVEGGGTSATTFRVKNDDGQYELSVDSNIAHHYANEHRWMQTGTSTPHMVLTSQGRLGINTVSPAYDFHVIGAGRFSNLQVTGLLAGNDGNQFRPDNLEINVTNRILYQVSSTNTSALGSGNSGQFLKSQGTNNVPVWDDVQTAGRVPIGGIIIWSGASNKIGSAAAGGTGTGWVICDGLNGTPNLVSKFVLGAADSVGDNTYPEVSPNTGGGSADAVIVTHAHGSSNKTSTNGSHGHSISNDSHTHAYTDPLIGGYAGLKSDTHGTATEYPTVNAGTTASSTTGITINANGNHDHTISSTGVSGTNKNLPPYWALCYIMRTA